MHSDRETDGHTLQCFAISHPELDAFSGREGAGGKEGGLGRRRVGVGAIACLGCGTMCRFSSCSRIVAVVGSGGVCVSAAVFCVHVEGRCGGSGWCWVGRAFEGHGQMLFAVAEAAGCCRAGVRSSWYSAGAVYVEYSVEYSVEYGFEYSA